MAQHIFSGATTPQTAPTAIGQHYIDTNADTSYISVGFATVGDWVATAGSGAGSSVLAIGTSIVSGTSGSILFVGNGLAQDNSNLFYSDATDTLIVEQARLNRSLHFKDNSAGGSNLITIYGTSLAAGYTLRLPIDDGTASQVLTTDGSGILSWTTVSGGAGSSQISIGISVASGTSGSLLFVGNGLAQDNSNLFYSDANNRLGIGTASPDEALHVAGVGKFNTSVRLQDGLSGGTNTITIYGPSLAAGYTLRLPVDDGTASQVLTTDGSGILSWATVSGSGSSLIGIGQSVVSGTSGSILFVGNGLAQDNSNLFYDDANNRLGVGTATPDTSLHVAGVGKFNTSVRLQDGLSGGTNTITIYGPSLAAGYTLRLPVDDGTASQVLTTDGSGILSWSTVSGAGSSLIGIGMSVVSGTSGSILFVGNGLAQDNTNLFFDDSNNRFITEQARVNNALQFKDALSGGTFLIHIYGPSLATGYTLRLPVDDGLDAQSLTGDGSGILRWRSSNAAYFGTGVTGSTTIASDITLAADAYYDSLTVNSGINLNTGGYRVFVMNTLSNAGTIKHNGNVGNAAGGAGAAATAGMYALSGAGGAGGTAAGSAGGSVTNSIGGAGSVGGTGSGGAGGAGGNASSPAAASGGSNAVKAMTFAGSPAVVASASRYTPGGGGGGGGGDGTAGGGGGSGGGVLYVSANRITGSGAFQAHGGDGGTPAAGNRGGGGGGGGGCVILISNTGKGSCTATATGGTGGTGSGTGTNGTNGVDGMVNELDTFIV